MKKIDKLIIKSFLGPFLLTFFVAVFILLMQHMLRYMDDLVGKGLETIVILELIGHFAIFMMPAALPLAVLLSSLMTYGNLGEHFELTAIKSAGISLVRILLPMFIFVCFITVLAFYSNNYLVPRAALRAYSLLYDIKRTKPALELKEGVFYDGIPGYSILVEEKMSDGIGLKNLKIYNHHRRMGNTQVIVADSGRMELINNNRYLSLELFDGKRFAEGESRKSVAARNKGEPGEFVRSTFKRSRYVFSLASFDLKQSDPQIFSSNKTMKDIAQLRNDIDSMEILYANKEYGVFKGVESTYKYHLKSIEIPKEILAAKERRDSLDAEKANKSKMNPDDFDESRFRESMDRKKKAISRPNLINTDTSTKEKKKETPKYDKTLRPKKVAKRKVNSPVPKKKVIAQSKAEVAATDVKTLNKQRNKPDSVGEINKGLMKKKLAMSDSILLTLSPWEQIHIKFHGEEYVRLATKKALIKARQVKNRMKSNETEMENISRLILGHEVKFHQKYAHAAACLVMFLIGAPLGAIIKKGGLGVPVLISIVFFITFWVLGVLGQKWGEESVMSPFYAVWFANAFLLPFGIVFLRQAKNDSRVFEADFYSVIAQRFRKLIGEKSKASANK